MQWHLFAYAIGLICAGLGFGVAGIVYIFK